MKHEFTCLSLFKLDDCKNSTEKLSKIWYTNTHDSLSICIDTLAVKFRDSIVFRYVDMTLLLLWPSSSNESVGTACCSLPQVYFLIWRAHYEKEVSATRCISIILTREVFLKGENFLEKRCLLVSKAGLEGVKTRKTA